MAVDYFLKIEGIPGESKDSKHKGEIELVSFSWGETNPLAGGIGGGGSAGKVQIQDFSFTKRIDKSSPKLFLACAKGDHFKEAILVARKAGGPQQEFFKYRFTDVVISSYQTGGSAQAEDAPLDQISFGFGKIQVEYRPQKPDGSLDAPIKAGWDVVQNKPA
jgi:type VI secretion system secreted protein Hcp